MAEFWGLAEDDTPKGYREMVEQIGSTLGRVTTPLPFPCSNHARTQRKNLAYKLATGKTARQLQRERGADKAVDLLTAAELEIYQRKEMAIAVLLDAGLCYDGIKAALAG